MKNYSHKALNKKFLSLSKNEVILDTYFSSWLAWPIVKERLWLSIANRDNPDNQSKRKFFNTFINLVKGSFESLLALIAFRKCKYLFGYVSHASDFTHVSFLNYFNQSHLHIIYDRKLKRAGKKITSLVLHESYTGCFLTAIAYIVKHYKRIKKIATVIEKIVMEEMPDLNRASVFKVCCLALAIFQVKYIYYQLLFRRLGIEKLLIQDADGKVGEVAAAKKLKIPIMEIQHGIFGPLDIDYCWLELHRPFKEAMPIPDQVLVYGDVWRELISKNKFWLREEIHLVGSPAIDFYRDSMPLKKRIAGSLKVLYVAQPFSRRIAIDFWKKMLKLQKDNNEHIFELMIKPHPSELGFADYEEIAKKFLTCKVLNANVNPYHAIMESDVVVGYTSMMLVEAIALGVPGIGLSAPPLSEDFHQTYALNIFKPFILIYENTELLYEYFRSIIRDYHYQKLRKKLISFSEMIFCKSTTNNDRKKLIALIES